MQTWKLAIRQPTFTLLPLLPSNFCYGLCDKLLNNNEKYDKYISVTATWNFISSLATCNSKRLINNNIFLQK